MASRLKKSVIKPVGYLLPDKLGNLITRLFSKRLIDELLGEVTDKFLEILLYGMNFAFWLSRGYRKNIKDFEGRYLFRTADNVVAASAIFKDGDMDVCSDAIDGWNVRITFKDDAALRAFLFSQNQDILNSILANEVEVDGNFNYLYKFGFMARDLAHRIGVI